MSAKIVNFGAVVTCDACNGTGCVTEKNACCPMCHGLGELRPTPKAVQGTIEELHEVERPRFDYSRLAGALDSIGDFVLVSVSHLQAATENVPDGTILDHSANAMLHLEAARRAIRLMTERAEEMRGRP